MSLVTSVQEMWTIKINFHHQAARPQTIVLLHVKSVCQVQMQGHVSCVKVGNIKQLQAQGSNHIHGPASEWLYGYSRELWDSQPLMIATLRRCTSGTRTDKVCYVSI